MLLLGRTQKKHPGDLPPTVPDVPLQPPMNYKLHQFVTVCVSVLASWRLQHKQLEKSHLGIKLLLCVDAIGGGENVIQHNERIADQVKRQVITT